MQGRGPQPLTSAGPGSRDLAGPAVFSRTASDTPHPQFQCDLDNNPLRGGVPIPSLSLARLVNVRSDGGGPLRLDGKGEAALLRPLGHLLLEP